MKTTVRQECKGFTLLETLIALMILAVALLGLAHLVGIAISQNAFARYTTVAIQVAQTKLEDLKSGYNAELESGTVYPDLTPGTHGPETVTLEAPSYTRQGSRQFLVSWEVTSSAGTRKTVAITVNPQVANAMQTKTITVTSLFSP